jgi:hypothetical protein
MIEPLLRILDMAGAGVAIGPSAGCGGSAVWASNGAADSSNTVNRFASQLRDNDMQSPPEEQPFMVLDVGKAITQPNEFRWE